MPLAEDLLLAPAVWQTRKAPVAVQASTICERGIFVQGRHAHVRLVLTRAVFDDLRRGLTRAVDVVTGNGELTAENIKEPMREIRRALLEADVSLPVAKAFISKLEANVLGVKVIPGVSPKQQLVKVVHDAMQELLGSKKADLNTRTAGAGPRQVILLAGLQGVGKTTACGKLAAMLKRERKRVLLVSTDVYRPAAIEQLQILSKQADVDFLSLPGDGYPPNMAKQALAHAQAEKYDVLLVDTAGRLQADNDMILELRDIQAAVNPTDTLLVVDAMTGQEAAALTKAFNDAVGITGAILTKMDGDARGGAALSIRAVSGQPIKFVGTGEKMDQLEPFYPDRMASRILGMGDILTLVEKAEKAFGESGPDLSMMMRMMSGKMGYDDLLQSFKMMSGMGGMMGMAQMMPGAPPALDRKQMVETEKRLKKFERIIKCMSPEERQDPTRVAKSAGMRRRLAAESECELRDVEELVSTFNGINNTAQSFPGMDALKGLDLEKLAGMDAFKGSGGQNRPTADAFKDLDLDAFKDMDLDQLMSDLMRDKDARNDADVQKAKDSGASKELEKKAERIRALTKLFSQKGAEKDPRVQKLYAKLQPRGSLDLDSLSLDDLMDLVSDVDISGDLDSRKGEKFKSRRENEQRAQSLQRPTQQEPQDVGERAKPVQAAPSQRLDDVSDVGVAAAVQPAPVLAGKAVGETEKVPASPKPAGSRGKKDGTRISKKDRRRAKREAGGSGQGF